MDVYGKALKDYFDGDFSNTLFLHNDYGDVEEMPVDVFFRDEDEMPELEQKALDLCRGKVLDVGAGVGGHTLLLQGHLQVKAIDISPLAVDIMKRRGVKNAQCQDVFELDECFDTLLFMMNGIGLTGSIDGLKHFLEHAKKLLLPGGQLIFDSSDISYLYEGFEMPSNRYYGEVGFCYEYKTEKGAWFNWLYIDRKTLTNLANEQGWLTEIVFDDGQDQYLAKLILA